MSGCPRGVSSAKSVLRRLALPARAVTAVDFNERSNTAPLISSPFATAIQFSLSDGLFRSFENRVAGEIQDSSSVGHWKSVMRLSRTSIIT